MLDLTRHTVAGWALVVALLPSIAGCEAVLGIRDARLDPSLSSKLDDLDANVAEGAAATNDPDGAEAPVDGGTANRPDGEMSGPVVCQPFDNAKRLKNLLPDGGLMPLPSQVSP